MTKCLKLLQALFPNAAKIKHDKEHSQLYSLDEKVQDKKRLYLKSNKTYSSNDR